MTDKKAKEPLLIDKFIQDGEIPEFAGTSKVADVLGVSPRAVRRACERGEIVAVRAFGRWLINVRKLAEKFDSSKQ